MKPTMRPTAYPPKWLKLTSISGAVEPWNMRASLGGVYNGTGTLEKFVLSSKIEDSHSQCPSNSIPSYIHKGNEYTRASGDTTTVLTVSKPWSPPTVHCNRMSK